MKKTNLNLDFDKEVKHFMTAFKTVIDKEKVAEEFASLTVKNGRKSKNIILKHFYGDDEPEFIIMSCISFGLVNFMIEDFYVVKEVLGYKYVNDMLRESSTYLKVVR